MNETEFSTMKIAAHVASRCKDDDEKVICVKELFIKNGLIDKNGDGDILDVGHHRNIAVLFTEMVRELKKNEDLLLQVFFSNLEPGDKNTRDNIRIVLDRIDKGPTMVSIEFILDFLGKHYSCMDWGSAGKFILKTIKAT